jgi:2,3-diaminopropionate biosynthesis protein SbnB
MLILSRGDVGRLLESREREVLDAVRDAYVAHATGDTSLPHSVFLRFPGDAANRIIALPAYLGGPDPVAGVKWVSSFPGNLGRGLDRAAAVIVLNSATTGQPLSLLEGSLISARRTGASAALAAAALHPDSVEQMAVIGCGVIGFEILRFLRLTRPELRRVTVYDVDRERAAAFVERCRRALPGLAAAVASELAGLLAEHELLAIATTALEPHLDLEGCPRGSTVLHVSLRDLTPAAILECDNVVDDPDHVCRAGTSLDLAQQLVNHRRFIRCSIGEILNGTAAARPDRATTTVFSPFGLGILDLAVAARLVDWARSERAGIELDGFVPPPEGRPEPAASAPPARPPGP